MISRPTLTRSSSIIICWKMQEIKKWCYQEKVQALPLERMVMVKKWKRLVAAISCCTYAVVGAVWQQPVDGPRWWAVSSRLLWLRVIWPCLRNSTKTCRLNLSSTGWLLHFTTFPMSFTAVVVTAHSTAQMLIATVCHCTPLHWLLIAYDHFQCYAVGNADVNTKLAIFRRPLSLLLTHNLTMLQTVLTMP